jgi:hypothetical protein
MKWLLSYVDFASVNYIVRVNVNLRLYGEISYSVLCAIFIY